MRAEPSLSFEEKLSSKITRVRKQAEEVRFENRAIFYQSSSNFKKNIDTHATKETVTYIQARLKTVWVRSNEGSTIDAHEVINSGAYGVIVNDFNAIYDVLESYPSGSYVRTAFNIAHRGLSGSYNDNSYTVDGRTYYDYVVVPKPANAILPEKSESPEDSSSSGSSEDSSLKESSEGEVSSSKQKSSSKKKSSSQKDNNDEEDEEEDDSGSKKEGCGSSLCVWQWVDGELVGGVAYSAFVVRKNKREFYKKRTICIFAKSFFFL